MSLRMSPKIQLGQRAIQSNDITAINFEIFITVEMKRY